MKGTPAGQKDRPEETRGQRGWGRWGRGRVSGRGEDAASPRVGWPELTSGAEGARLGGGGANKSTSWEGILCGAGGGEGSVRSVKGFKLERGAKGSV